MDDTLALGRVHIGDIRELAPRLAPGSVNCVVTSPPYWQLRSYLDAADPAKARELGSEPTVGEFVANLVAVFRLLRPALRDDGTLWVNLGDSYANNPSTSRIPRAEQGNGTGAFRIGDEKHHEARRQGPNRLTALKREGIPHKCLTLAPARFALAMVDDGWICRSVIRWCKKAAMPESVSDRPTSAVEEIYMFVKRPRYWYDAEAVKEPNADGAVERFGRDPTMRRGEQYRDMDGESLAAAGFRMPEWLPNGRNARNFMLLGPEPYANAHYATFPSAIPRFAIRAGCPPRVCARCGAPWVRETADSPAYAALKAERGRWGTEDGDEGRGFGRRERGSKGAASGHDLAALGPTRVTTGWRATCACDAETVPGVVLDCFSGSGTTPMVAVEEGRRWLACDLDPRAVAWTRQRLDGRQIRLGGLEAAG